MKFIRTVLNGLQNVEHYIDDILVTTDTSKERVATLEKLFDRTQQAKLMVKPTKCEIGFQAISFLGHRLGIGHVATKNDILVKIQAAHTPTTKKEVQSFLGLTGYYRELIPGDAHIDDPPVEFTKKRAGCKVNWTTEHEDVFVTLKQ